MIDIVTPQSPADPNQISALLQRTTRRHVLLVVPPDSAHLLDQLVDARRLAGQAQRLGITLGVVTRDPLVALHARAAGLPAYPTVERGRRGLLNPPRVTLRRRRPRLAGAPTVLDAADRSEASRRLRTRPRWLRFLGRYYAVLLFVLTLTIVAIATFYLLPGARLTLQPRLEPLTVSAEITVDPRLDNDPGDPATLPGQLLVTVEKWRAGAPTTGTIELPSDPARGVVVFVNRLPQPVTIPAGTRVSSSAGTRVTYQTLQRVELAGAIGAQATVDVVALVVGSAGNVPANRVNRVEGALAPYVSVNNLKPIEGGSQRTAPTATEADKARLREHVLTQLLSRAAQALAADVPPGQLLAVDSLRVVAVYDEVYSHFDGEETDELTLEMRAEIHATAIDSRRTERFARALIERAVPAAHTLLPDSVRVTLADVVALDDLGRVRATVVTQGVTAADLPLNDVLNTVAGQQVPVALAYIDQNLPLRAPTTVSVWPGWFGRFPYVPVRVRTTVDLNWQPVIADQIAP